MEKNKERQLIAMLFVVAAIQVVLTPAQPFSISKKCGAVLEHVQQAEQHVASEDVDKKKDFWNKFCAFFSPSERQEKNHLAQNITAEKISTRLQKALESEKSDPQNLSEAMSTLQKKHIDLIVQLSLLSKLKDSSLEEGASLETWINVQLEAAKFTRQKEILALRGQKLMFNHTAAENAERWKADQQKDFVTEDLRLGSEAQKRELAKIKTQQQERFNKEKKKMEKQEQASKDRYCDEELTSWLKFQYSKAFLERLKRGEFINQLLAESLASLIASEKETGKEVRPLFSPETINLLRTSKATSRKDLIKLVEYTREKREREAERLRTAQAIFDSIDGKLEENNFDEFARQRREEWVEKRTRLMRLSAVLAASGVTIFVASSWFKSKKQELSRDLKIIENAKISSDSKQKLVSERKKTFACYLPNWIKRLFFGYDLEAEITALESSQVKIEK